MKPAPIPERDAERLAALHRLLILDTAPEERYDKIIKFASAEFDVPIALLSLVDSDRQWFKARTGLDVCETSREISFCGHAVHAEALLVVEDTLLDPRFADNPLVLADPHIRFYAGMPLRLSDGAVVGTLCLIDRRPRTLDPIDIAILGTLRDLAVVELERGADGAASAAR